VSIAAVFGRGGSFYDGTPGHELVKCPDCGLNADALFGSHDGECLTAHTLATPMNALGIIRQHALLNGSVTANDVRAAMDQAGVPGPSRGPAFAAAERRGWIERDGYAPSTGAATKHHPIAVYRSCIYVGERVA
jgi:hypothetical protein